MGNKKVYGNGRLTDEDHDRIHELAAQGMKAPSIARAINRHPGTVHWFMYSAGLAAPKPNPNRCRSYVRSGRTIHHFCADEDALITALRVQNLSLRTIAEQCNKRFCTNRTQHTVRVRLVMLAAREDAA